MAAKQNPDKEDDKKKKKKKEEEEVPPPKKPQEGDENDEDGTCLHMLAHVPIEAHSCIPQSCASTCSCAHVLT